MGERIKYEIYNKGDLVPNHVLNIEPYVPAYFTVDGVFVFREDDKTHVAPLFPMDEERICKIADHGFEMIECNGFPTHWYTSMESLIKNQDLGLSENIEEKTWSNSIDTLTTEPCKRINNNQVKGEE